MSDEVRALAIVVPVLNDSISLRMMLRILRATIDVPHEVIVVSERVDDEHLPAIQQMQRENEHIRLVQNRLGHGVMNAIRAGVEASKADVILIFAADEVGPVLAVDEMLELIREGYDFISCTRYAHGGRRLGGSMIEGTLSRVANRLFTRFGGSALTDVTTGIKMFRRELFDRLVSESRPVGWVCTCEMSIKAQLAGLKIAEIPIVSIDRLYGGNSTFELGPWAMEYLRWFAWGAVQLNTSPKADVTVRVPRSINWRGQTDVNPPPSIEKPRPLERDA